MKKLLLIAGISALLIGCSEHDEAYYGKHLQKAEDVVLKCETNLAKARENNDQKSEQYILEDQECNAARSALTEAKYQTAKANIAQVQAKVETELKGKDWQEIVKVYDDAKCDIIGSPEHRVECDVLKGFYQKAIVQGTEKLMHENLETFYREESFYCGKEAGVQSICNIWHGVIDEKTYEILNPLSLQELQSVRGKYCNNHSVAASCSSWERVWKAKNNALVTNYVKDEQKFVEGYNRCVERVGKINRNEKLTIAEKQKSVRKIRETTPCSQIQEAFIEKGLGNSTSFGVKLGM